MSRRKAFAGLVLVTGAVFSFSAAAEENNKLRLPAKGVVCDAYFCADATGISDSLTAKYLGAKKGQWLVAQGAFDRTAFTFASGVYCDTKEKVCRKDRYFGADGKPSGETDRKTTRWLFPQ
ncbi:YcgJ family protein [Enterobacter ludwigii]|uniref:YcgJ family protein n=1 Tax=Enterobacter ludwigii TaxID=299767 RepID=UPI00186858FC|nr:YcgJ family protein [Enterobacter ludwigii]